MKKINSAIALMILLTGFLFIACDDCKTPKVRTLADSVCGEGFHHRLFCEISVNGEIVGEGDPGQVVFEVISAEEVGAVFDFNRGTTYIKIEIARPILLEGKLYDVTLAYDGTAGVRIGDDIHKDVKVTLSGWMTDKTRTRCDPYEGDYHGEFKLEFAIGDHKYLITTSGRML